MIWNFTEILKFRYNFLRIFHTFKIFPKSVWSLFKMFSEIVIILKIYWNFPRIFFTVFSKSSDNFHSFFLITWNLTDIDFKFRWNFPIKFLTTLEIYSELFFWFFFEVFNKFLENFSGNFQDLVNSLESFKNLHISRFILFEFMYGTNIDRKFSEF